MPRTWPEREASAARARVAVGALALALLVAGCAGAPARPAGGITAEDARQRVMNVPEVKRECAWRERVTRGKVHGVVRFEGLTLVAGARYWAIGFFADHHTHCCRRAAFLVAPATGKILVENIPTGEVTGLREWQEGAAKRWGTSAGDQAKPDVSPMPTRNRGPRVNPDADSLEGKILVPHLLDPADTLEDIAELYGSRVRWIKLANPGVKSNADLKQIKAILVPVPADEQYL